MSQPPPDPNPVPMGSILDSLDALVYVSDMQTHDLLYMNAYGRRLWGEPGGRRCWETIQTGQTGPCVFCTNHRLLDVDGKPKPPYVWEFQNTVTQHWYQCRDQAIVWTDGRLVRMEIATDITDRKRVEEQLKHAKQLAENLAQTDELTGLRNRRAFFALGIQTLHQMRRSIQPVSLVMFDADNFKQINDHYGHSAGDKVLVAMTQAAAPLVRDADIFARIGGEEFAILLAGQSAEEATALAERLRQALMAMQVRYGNSDILCTASFGIAQSPDAQHSLEQLLSEADHAMYRAKAAGRNRIEVAGRFD